MASPDWTLTYTDFSPAAQGLREALCTLGNGYFCTRGALPHAEADEVNYPGTYLAGGYNRLTTTVAGRDIVNEDLVNLPNWLRLRFRILTEGEPRAEWFTLATADLLDYRQELSLRDGLLSWALRFRDRHGRTTAVGVRRLVSMDDMHLAAQEMVITPEDWSGTIEVDSTLDGRIINAGVARYRDLASSHLDIVEACPRRGARSGAELCLLVTEFTQSRLRIAQAARTLAYRDGAAVDAPPRTGAAPGAVYQTFRLEARQGEAVRVEKVVALYTGRDRAISEPGAAAIEAADGAPSFAVLAERQAAAWARLWSRCDIIIDSDIDSQMILRLHVFHLLQTLSPNTIDLDVGVPARGWHGEAYRGHVFWDELFILPFLNFRLPAISRAMLRYRYNRLPKARQAAAAAGFRGAMFPWQSGSDGREESQVMHLNPRSGRWVPDNTWAQRHVSLAIAYNAWQYVQATGDRTFLENRGAELMLEVARFFSSLARFDEGRQRYVIRQVMGPDEYHDATPGVAEPGIDNNAYTNVLVAWLMQTADEVLAALDADHRAETVARLGLDAAELERWRDIGRRMIVPFHADDDGAPGIISQFEGYEALREFDWEGYRRRYGDIQRLDRILEAEGDSANCYKLSKQADVLMLFHLFSQPRLAEMLGRLGYDFTPEMWQRNIDYYLARTSHGSTLSYLVHSWVLARSRPDKAWDLFLTALRSDLSDIQGGTTAEGIHLGAMAGTVDLVQRCFTGLEVRDGALHFDPVLTGRLRSLTLKLRWRGHWIDLFLSGGELTLRAHPGWPHPVPVVVRGERVELRPGESHAFPPPPAAAPADDASPAPPDVAMGGPN
ncbi:glycoside hydrolase family 65 protein [Novispirillum sp. DQ9]|uniref:glycoside hydrolase family 65 protein n=1 Tax=Novispirillum sp. DQ9 TaxID=3398612 RepID=UPI003C7E79C5